MRRAARDDGGTLLARLHEPTGDGPRRDARVSLLAHDARERVDGLGRARPPGTELLQQGKAVGDQDSAGRRRRIRDVLLAAEARRDRTAPDDSVALEILPGDTAAVRADMLGDLLGELPFVENLSPLFGE